MTTSSGRSICGKLEEVRVWVLPTAAEVASEGVERESGLRPEPDLRPAAVETTADATGLPRRAAAMRTNDCHVSLLGCPPSLR
jgi:hypothetical protein